MALEECSTAFCTGVASVCVVILVVVGRIEDHRCRRRKGAEQKLDTPAA